MNMVSGFPYPTNTNVGGKVGRPRMSRGPTKSKRASVSTGTNNQNEDEDSDFDDADDGEDRGQGLGFSPTIQYVLFHSTST
jgi:hypothetical protein